MTNVSRLTLATLLMGSLALPAIAQDTKSDAKSPKDVSAMKITETVAKPSLLKNGVHKAAATSEVPAAVTKAPVAGTPAAPSKDAKAKDGAVKPQTTVPVTKTN